MKHTLYIVLAMLMATASAKAQQADSAPDPDTWYQYQKDEGFEAFLLDRVDSIVYSRFDLDSVLHDDVVVQEVWFQGQVQRFLLETIDSIGFYKPETKFCDEVFHLTAFHVPYTVGIDSLTLTFDSSIPSDHLPLVGQVVVSDVRTHPYERGFAGRVRQIDNTTEGIVLVCDRVSIVDIYKQLVAVGHVQATPDDNDSNQPGNSRRRVNVEDETYDLITDKEFSLPLKVMTIKDKINYSVDYTVNIGMFKKPIVKVYVNGRHELKGTSTLNVKDKAEWEVWPKNLSWYFPIPGLEILTVSLKFGGFAYAGGKMELKGEVPLTLTHQMGFEWEDNILTPIKSFDYEWGDPEVTLDLKGTVRAGIQMQLGINLISDDIVSANITGKIGPQLDADLVLSSDGVRDLSWYQALKDTKATLSLYTSLDAAFEVFGNDIEDVLDISLTEPWEKNWLKTDRYLLPEFTQPELVPYTPDYADYSLTSMMTVPSRSTLLPVGVGIGMFDRGGNRIAEKWSGQWWTDDPEKPAKKVQYDLSTAEGHRTHIFRPIVKLLGMTLDAYPEAEFTVPGKLTLAENSVMMNEGTAKIIEITDGWGIYGNATDQQDMVKVSLYGELDGKHYLRLDALQAGETTVAVKDIRTGKTVSIPVKVVDPNALIVNPYNVTVVENHTADVSVKGGSGHYRVSTEDTEKIQAEIEGNTIHVTALAPGDAIILVQDSQSDYFANIQVKINATPKSVYLAQSINMTAGDTRNIEISGKNGQVEIYKEADFINISSDNPDVATVRLVPGNTYYMVKVYALKEGVAHVTIEDTTTGDQSVMEVNVGPTSSITYTVTDGDYTTYTVNGVPFKMINVEGGTFTMGRTPEQAVDYLNSECYFWNRYNKRMSKLDDYNLDVPAHEETVADFSIGEKQVTWELYKAVMGGGNGDDDSPVDFESIDYFPADFTPFINRLREMTGLPFRKPTEAEWEYAARGGKYSKGYKYPGTNDVIAASFGVPNELGISGMVGGYTEACEDGMARGGLAQVVKYDDAWSSWNQDDIIPWISYRGGGGTTRGDGLRLVLGGSPCPPKSWIGVDGYRYDWPNALKVPLWGESSLTFTGGYGEYEVTSKDPEIVTGYTQGNKLIAESHSGGNTTLTITDKRNSSSLDVDVSVDYIDFAFWDLEDYGKIPIGIDYLLDSKSDNGRFKYNVSDESGIMLSTTPDKKVSIRGLKLGQYHVAVTDIGSHKTIEWDTEVIDTLGFDRNYITIREGHTDSVLVTHSNGMIYTYCSKDDEYYNIIDQSPNGYIYDNVIRITPTEPGVYVIRVEDYVLDRIRLDGNYEKHITVVVPDERSEKREQVLSELDKTKSLAIQAKKVLGSKATAEQAPDLYNTLFDINADIFCIGANTKSAETLPELEELEAHAEDVRLKLNQLYEQVSQLSQIRTDEDVTEKSLCPDDHHPHLIDLGLPSGTKWACCNVEANSVEEIGKYYFWGETEERTEYEYGTYQAPPIFDIEGTTYDAARVKWGEPWQMPTNSQWDELLEQKRTFTSRNGINGYLLEGNNGNAIFIPTVNSYYLYSGPTGFTGYYWSSTSFRHYYMGKDQLGYYDNMFFNGDFWCSVRPVVPSSGDIPDPQVLELQKQELKSTLQTLLDELELIAQELSMKATEGQAPNQYSEYYEIKETCASILSMIDSAASEDDIDNSQTDLDAIATRMAALRSQVENYQPIRNIIFVDANVKAICVENWDTNGDGELSYDEAAAVKDLGKDFQRNRKITSFNELQYFTGLTGIGDDIFVYCESLTSVSIPNFMTRLGNRAFYHCSSLKSITIPSSIYYIGEMAFEGCGGLTSIVVEDGNTVYDSRENCNAIITTQDNELIAGCGNTTIPNSVTSIRGDVFHRCNDLKSIVIPASVTSIGIGYGVTCGCSNLTSIVVEKENTLFDSRDNCNAIINTETNELIAGCKNTIIPSTVASIGVNAFAECSGLTNITIPNSVTSIGGGSFHHCGFTSITIPNSVTTIGELAFMDCSALTEIFSYLEEPCSLGQGCWHNVDKSIPLYVPKGTKAKYQTTDGWKEFKNIVEMGGEIEPDKIAFADAAVKFVCLANWDIDDDGQISYEEAAAVTDLGESFHNNWQIKSFDELQYFTGLTSIGERAFSLCNSLTSVTIPNSVTSIGNSAFYDCSALASVTIPNSVTSIGNSAFSWCSNLASVVIPESVTSIGEWAFNGTGLTSITIPGSVSSIETCAFQNCHSLTSVIIPNSVTSIGGYAFAGCSGLATVTIPNSITKIGYRAFAGCTGLTEIRSYIEKFFYINPECWIDVNKNIPLYVPEGTKALYESNEGWNVFTNIVEMGNETPQDPSIIKFADTYVKNICVENWDTNGDGELSYDEAAAVTDLGQLFYNNKDITSFDELRYFTGLKSISENAFSWSSLKSVTIPHNVVDIGQQSFAGCNDLKSIIIPKSVTSIAKVAFYYNRLTSIVVEDGNTVYDSRDNCNAIIHTATNELVHGCANTIIPNSVTSIGNCAFWGCAELKSISIPSSVTTIGTGAFADCYYLTDISIPSSVTTIGVQAFQSTGFSSIDIPSSVTSIGKSAFTNCHLTSVTIPSSITSIEQGTFYYCESLASVTIPNSIISIGMNAFQFCSSLSSITSHIGIPRAIDNSVFSNLPEDVTLYVPYGTKSFYEATDGWKNFKNIVEMESDPNNPIIVFADAEVKRICVANWDVNGDGELSYDEAAAVKDLGRVFEDNWNIKSFDELQYFTGLTTISERALSGCLELTSITLPNSVTSIGTYALFDNYYLTSITIPNSVTYIGRYAFCFCRGLTNIVIPNSVTTIDEWAFDGCTKLSSVTIPNSVTSIGESAFFGCSNLTEVYSYFEKPYRVGCWASVDNCTLYVPAGTKAKYEATDGWKGFKNIVEMEGETPNPDEPDPQFIALKQQLQTSAIECMADLEGVLRMLLDKDPNQEAKDFWALYYACNKELKEFSWRVDNAKTVNELEEAQKILPKLIEIIQHVSSSVKQLGETPGPDEPDNKLNVMKQELENWAEKCEAQIEYASSFLRKKDPEGQAKELWSDLYSCEAYWQDISYRINKATTENELINAEKELNELMAKIDYVTVSVEKYEPVKPLTVTTVEGIELTLKIISEAEKTVQVGDGQYAAASQSATGSVTIPATAGDYKVVAIAKQAFNGCSGLKSIHIPASVTSLADNFLGDCRNLTSLTVATDNPVYNSPANSNAIVKTADKTLVAACNSTVLPEGIKTIGGYAFAYCDAFETLDLPDGVSSFNNDAFAYSNIRLIATGGINQIGFAMGAFNCSKVEVFYIRQTDGTLSMFCNGKMWRYAFVPGWPVPTFTTYAIPEKVHIGDKDFAISSLGSSAFYNCTQLTELTIPATITAIDKYAFSKCTAIRTITSYNREPFAIDNDLFVSEVYAEATLYVPAGTKATYQATEGWKHFKNIVEIGK